MKKGRDPIAEAGKTFLAAVVLMFALAFGVLACLRVPEEAAAHYKRCAETRDSRSIICRRHHTYHAALAVWCGNAYRPCWKGVKMFSVASCETGRTFDYWARNGQYRGLWQMGSRERAICGETWGKDPWTQARAAACWLRATSLASWECA